jgi:hypothetical protein
MLEAMKKKISEDIKKIKETGEITAKKIKSVVEDAVFETVQNTKDGATQINTIAKEAVTVTVKELKNNGIEKKSL